MRLQLIFDGKPEENTRNILKSNGFRWSPKNMAWQRHLNANSDYALKCVLKEIEENKKALTMRQHDESNEPANN